MYESLSQYVREIRLPRFVAVEQSLDGRHIPVERLPLLLREKLAAPGCGERIRSGDRVAITCGSRGIRNLALILRTIVEFCKEQGADPFIIPAMGSHGGATAAGQEEVLAGLGVTAATMDCPIRATMETVVIGQTEAGQEVYLDAYAAAADRIIVVNRIKPHTSFRGPYESGLMKMIAIGLGKQKGADACHGAGYKYMAARIPAFATVTLREAPIVFGVGILENAREETAELQVIPAEQIAAAEPELLKKAAALLPRLPFPSCDVLVVDEIGKDISGGGMDPNVSGAFSTPYASGGIRAQMRCILALTEKTHGSAYGMGAADVVSKRLFEAVDFEKTYPNSITSTALSFSKLPLVMPNDRDAIALCVKSCTDIDKENPRIIRIHNTLTLDRFWISEAMVPEAIAIPGVRVVGEPAFLGFDEGGNLAGRRDDERRRVYV